MENPNRDFKGIWIPREIWLDSELTALDKIILAEIDSLDNGERGCFASNKYLADFSGCSESKVSKSISKLIERGYIVVSGFDGRQRELKSCLSRQKCEADSEKMTDSIVKNATLHSKKCEADSEKMLHINIENNIENNIEDNIGAKPRKRFTAPTLKEVSDYCTERENNIDAEHFINYYEARGWELSKGRKMKDWRAAIRTWEKNSYSQTQKKGANGVKVTGAKADILDDIL